MTPHLYWSTLMSESEQPAVTPTDMLALTCSMVAAYVSHNATPITDMPGLIRDTHAALTGIVALGPATTGPAEPLVPAVSVKKSITDDFIVCLENGKKFKSLKKHLASSYGMTAAEYRAKWGLPADYPMVAPNYAAKRSEIAKTINLGRKALANEMAA